MTDQAQLTVPPTELEVAALLDVLGGGPAGPLLRRLAFDRDRLRGACLGAATQLRRMAELELVDGAVPQGRDCAAVADRLLNACTGAK